jgi:hypothetical protein
VVLRKKRRNVNHNKEDGIADTTVAIGREGGGRGEEEVEKAGSHGAEDEGEREKKW